jgi:transposase
MSRSIEADYDQVYLFPPCLEDWIPPEHPARFIRAFVLEALAGGVELDWGSAELVGQPHYGPRLLLGLWLYGYFQRIRSPRRLEAACRNDVG